MISEEEKPTTEDGEDPETDPTAIEPRAADVTSANGLPACARRD
jgi:hypothetical protein